MARLACRHAPGFEAVEKEPQHRAEQDETEDEEEDHCCWSLTWGWYDLRFSLES